MRLPSHVPHFSVVSPRCLMWVLYYFLYIYVLPLGHPVCSALTRQPMWPGCMLSCNAKNRVSSNFLHFNENITQDLLFALRTLQYVSNLCNLSSSFKSTACNLGMISDSDLFFLMPICLNWSSLVLSSDLEKVIHAFISSWKDDYNSLCVSHS